MIKLQQKKINNIYYYYKIYLYLELTKLTSIIAFIKKTYRHVFLVLYIKQNLKIY